MTEHNKLTMLNRDLGYNAMTHIYMYILLTLLLNT